MNSSYVFLSASFNGTAYNMFMLSSYLLPYTYRTDTVDDTQLGNMFF